MADGETRNEQLVREFFETLSTGDLEALRARLHPDGSWEAMGTTIPGAGVTTGGRGDRRVPRTGAGAVRGR